MVFYKEGNKIGLLKTNNCFDSRSSREICFEYLINYDRIFKNNGFISFVDFNDACENTEQFVDKYGFDCNDITFSYRAGISLTGREKIEKLQGLKFPVELTTVRADNIQDIIEFESRFLNDSGMNLFISCIVPTDKIHKLDRNSVSKNLRNILKNKEPTIPYLMDLMIFKESDKKFYLNHELN